MTKLKVVLALLVAALMVAPSAVAANGPKNKDNDTYVQLLAFNDLHGNLEPPTGSSARVATGPGQTVDAGGAEYFATHIKQLRMTNTNTLVVAAGDAIGASPLVSALFHDEPTIEAMNLWGTDIEGVGNHEFDEGVNELLRMQYGNQNGGDGCHPEDGCQDDDPFGGALFQYLAANVFWKNTNETILPAYEIRKIDNAKIAFIGLTLEGTSSIVSQEGIKDVYFAPEVETVNALVAKLREEKGVRSFVVLVHQGGQQNAPFAAGFENINGCENFTGPIVDIAKGLAPEVDVIVSAHTHRAYNCEIAGRPVTSAASFGRLITDIDLVIDHQSKDVKGVTVTNRIVTRGVAKDADETKLLDKYRLLSNDKKNAIVGRISADITTAGNAAGESALGDVIADAQLFVTAQDHHGDAVVAFMNPGGIRKDLTYSASAGGEAPGEITYGELFDVQPFTNYVVTKTMTGQQIYDVLEQQWSGPNAGTNRKILQVSNGFTYQYTAKNTGAVGAIDSDQHVVPGSVMIGGVPVNTLATYRVTMNSFLADGQDNFPAFALGTEKLVGMIDLDALVNYFEMKGTVDPGPQNRITRTVVP